MAVPKCPPPATPQSIGIFKLTQTKTNLPYQTKPNQTKPSKLNQTYQTKDKRYQTKHTKPNIPNQMYQTKPTKPNLSNLKKINKPNPKKEPTKQNLPMSQHIHQVESENENHVSKLDKHGSSQSLP